MPVDGWGWWSKRIDQQGRLTDDQVTIRCSPLVHGERWDVFSQERHHRHQHKLPTDYCSLRDTITERMCRKKRKVQCWNTDSGTGGSPTDSKMEADAGRVTATGKRNAGRWRAIIHLMDQRYRHVQEWNGDVCCRRIKAELLCMFATGVAGRVIRLAIFWLPGTAEIFFLRRTSGQVDLKWIVCKRGKECYSNTKPATL